MGETRQTVDLADLLGRKPKAAEKELFVQRAIERILERTQDGKSIENRNFRQYTKDYAEQKGVSRRDVDMTLFGDMLLAVKRLRSDSESKVDFGINDRDEAVKSFAHNTGYEGHPNIPAGKYRRRWFGLTKTEAQKIADQILKENTTRTVREIREETQENLRDLIEDIRLEVNDAEGDN